MVRMTLCPWPALHCPAAVARAPRPHLPAPIIVAFPSSTFTAGTISPQGRQAGIQRPLNARLIWHSAQPDGIVNGVPTGSRLPFNKRSQSLAIRRVKFAVNRLAPLRERNFRRFYAGYVTSLLGTSMSGVAIIFAVLGSGGTATDLGYVAAAGIVPQVAFILAGGGLADRLGRRPVMLCADALPCCAPAALAAALFLRRPPLWLFILP